METAFVESQAAIVNVAQAIPADVAGWCDGFVFLYAQQVAQAREGARFVEVGTWLGKSAILMAWLIQASGKDINFWAVDHFRGSGSDTHEFQAILDRAGGTVRPLFDANARRHGVADKIEVLEMDSTDAARSFADGSLDFVFIDADHAYENVRADIEAWAGKVRSGGLLAGHDWGYMGVAQAVIDCFPGERIWVMGQVWLYYKP